MKPGWIRGTPTINEIVRQFERYVRAVVNHYRDNFRMTPEDLEDLHQSLFVKLLELLIAKVKKTFYVCGSWRNSAANWMAERFGVPHKKAGCARISKTQQTASLDEILASTDPRQGRVAVKNRASVLRCSTGSLPEK